jgi:hypothetical protein
MRMWLAEPTDVNMLGILIPFISYPIMAVL